MDKKPSSTENIKSAESGFLKGFKSINGKQRFSKFLGLSSLIAVGYMDPGNWATDLLGGSQYGYLLISVILISSLMGMFFQYLSIKLGATTGFDLAQSCRNHYHPKVNFTLWIFAEIAIISTDIAEVIGTAIALNLLFHIPLLLATILTIVSVFIFFIIAHNNFRVLEIFIISLITVVLISFTYSAAISGTRFDLIAQNLLPSMEIIKNKEILFIAIGILGATVMPHNLYLHSSIVNTRSFGTHIEDKKQTIRFVNLDSCIALFIAFLINAAILVVAANTFYFTGHGPVDSIEKAYHLLSPMLGAAAASTVFAIALLAAGENSSITGTMAGQIIMEGFLKINIKPWLRRFLTRLLAIIPVVIFIIVLGDKSVTKLLVLSQVVLSLQLPFALVPLLSFTSSKSIMGELKNKRWTIAIGSLLTVVVIILNTILIISI